MLTLLGWACHRYRHRHPAQPSPRTAGGDVDVTGLGWADLAVVIVAQLSPDQEQPEAMLTFMGWAGFVIVIVTQPSPAQERPGEMWTLLGWAELVIVIVNQLRTEQPRPRTAGGDVDITWLGWPCYRYHYR